MKANDKNQTNDQNFGSKLHHHNPIFIQGLSFFFFEDVVSERLRLDSFDIFSCGSSLRLYYIAQGVFYIAYGQTTINSSWAVGRYLLRGCEIDFLQISRNNCSADLFLQINILRAIPQTPLLPLPA